MFEFDRIGVYEREYHSTKSAFVRVSYIGNEPITFLDNRFINENFKKINVIVLVQKGNSVFVDDDELPHVRLSDRDLNNVYGIKTNDAILEEAARRAAYNAGTTIKDKSISLVGKVESDEVYYIYSALSGSVISPFAKTIPISSLTRKSFLDQCTLAEIRV